MPKLGNLKVRRTWRGLYPMTPDGSPIVGKSPELEGYIDAIGMCGQGYMLGPGVGALVARLATGELREGDAAILAELSPARVFGGVGPEGPLRDPYALAYRELYARQCPLVLRRQVGVGAAGEVIVEEWSVREMTLPMLRAPY